MIEGGSCNEIVCSNELFNLYSDGGITSDGASIKNNHFLVSQFLSADEITSPILQCLRNCLSETIASDLESAGGRILV